MDMTLDLEPLEDSIARTFGTDPIVMPVLDVLLQDIAVLGVPVEQVLSVFRPLKLKGIRTLLDVGCGKGMAAVALARDLCLDVTGIDAHGPFLDEARRRARIMGLSDRCRFVQADARRPEGLNAGYDAVAMLACPALFGTVRDTVAALRRCVAPGGFLVLDQACRLDAGDGGDDVPDLTATVAALTAFGDRIVMAKHGRNLDAITLAERRRDAVERRAREMLRTYPGIAGTVWQWVEALRRQVEQNALGGPVTPSIWVIEKATR